MAKLAVGNMVTEALARLPATARPEVLHQCGGRHLEATREAYAGSGVEARVAPFLDDMAEAYAWADLVVCRAGAMTIAEVAAAGAASLLVPFPHAVDDHQTHNARFLADAGAARLLPQPEADAERLAALLGELLGDRAGLRAMAERARELAVTGSAERVADHCLEVARV